MAKKIGLSVYSFSLYDGKSRRELHDVLAGRSFLQMAEEYAKANENTYSADKWKETVFAFDLVQAEEVRDSHGAKEFDVLLGRAKTGEYGMESELVDVNDGTVTERKESQADVLPFGFCIAVAAGMVDKGVILLQTTGSYGMKAVFEKKLRQCMDYYKTEYTVLWGQITPKAYIDNFFRRGRLEKVRLIRHSIPEDISERYGINYGVRETREERIICRPVGFLQHWSKELGEWLAGQRSCTDIIEIEDYEYDDMKLEFEMGKMKKTISLSDTRGLKVSEDITDFVVVRGGSPTFDSLREVLVETAREYLAGMGLLAR